MAKVPIARIEGAGTEGVAPQDAREDRGDTPKKAAVTVETVQHRVEEPLDEPRSAAANAEEEPAAKPAEVGAAAKPKVAAKPKARPKAKPKTKVAPTVEGSEPAAPCEGADSEPTDEVLEDEPNDAFEQARSMGQAFKAWLAKTFPGNVHAVIGGVCGLLVAILFFVFGFWKTLLVCLLVTIGVALGQYLDGNPRIVNLIRRLVSEGRGGN